MAQWLRNEEAAEVEQMLPDIDYDFVVPAHVQSSMYDSAMQGNKRVKVLRERRETLRQNMSLEPMVDRQRDPDDKERSLLRRPDLQARQAEIDKGNPPTPNAPFDVEQGEEVLRKRGYLRYNWAVHDQRAAHDPLYAMLYCPHAVMRLIDTETMETHTVRFIDKVCNDCMTWIEMHYNWNDVIKTDERTQKAFGVLRETNNTRIKLFAIIAFMSFCPRIKQHLESLYNENSFRKRADFNRAAQAAYEMVEVMRLKSEISRVNIYAEVKRVIRAVGEAYLRPPGFLVRAGHNVSTRRARH